MGGLKSRLRKEILRRRRSLTEADVQKKSLLIKEKLFSLKRFQDAKIVMFYASFEREVDTREMIKEASIMGKRIALPAISSGDGIKPYFIQDVSQDLYPGYFGIPEPRIKEKREVDLREIELIIVPGIVFDRRGYRIGFGRGYYDRFLNSFSCRPFCIGLGFEMQMIDNIPFEPYDARLDMVITDCRIYEFEL